MKSIQQEMDSILGSKEIKSLFSKYKTAGDSSTLDKLDGNTELDLDDNLSHKFPEAILTLEKIGWADKYPAAYEALCSNSDSDSDVTLANDRSFKKDFPEAYEALEVAGFKEKYPEFFNEVIGNSSDDILDNPDLLSDNSDMDDLGDMEVGGLSGFASFDVAIDSLLTASASLDNLGFDKTASNVLTLAAKIVEAKKKAKEDKADKKDKKLKDKKKDSKDSKDSKDKKDMKDMKDKDSKSKFPFKKKEKEDKETEKDLKKK